MVEYQENSKNMENLNIIIEINEDGEMTNFDIALRNTELPYKNTEEYEYTVEEFEKVKEVNNKKFRCLLARELNCFACTAIYRFQLIFVRRKRKIQQVVEYIPVRNRIQAPITITAPMGVTVRQHQPQPIVKVVPKVVSPIVQNNFKTVTTVIPPQQRQVTQVNQVTQHQINMQRQVDASRLRQMLEKRAVVQQKPQPVQQFVVKKEVVLPKQNYAQRRIQSQIVPDVGSSEEDIETEIIDSSMVEVQMESNSNSPQLGAKKPVPVSTKVVVKREPNVTVEDVKQSQVQTTPKPQDVTMKHIDLSKNFETNTFKCDLCSKEFHSLRQRQRHRVTHTTQAALASTPLACKTCSKVFLNKEALIVHEKTHAGRKSEPTMASKIGNTTTSKTKSPPMIAKKITPTRRSNVKQQQQQQEVEHHLMSDDSQEENVVEEVVTESMEYSEGDN